jgi:sporulation protein YlmC with PRC-barrel domain
MKAYNYILLSLLLISFVFVGGRSFADDWVQEQIAGYNAPTEGISDTFSTSRMLWSQVYTPDALYVATISDLVADFQTGRVSEVILSGIKNLGAREVCVPFGSVELTGHNIFVYHAPEDVYQYYGEAPYWDEGFYRYSGEKTPMGSFRIGESIGAMVRNSKGDEVGQINDFVVDPRDGHLTHVVLLDARGMEGKTTAFPFNAFSRSSEGAFILNM